MSKPATSEPASATPPSTDPPILQIYNQINGLFGGKAGQLFTMEFPGRILDMGSYAYNDSASIDAQQTKPQEVVEAEFRLSDDLYTLGRQVGGPKGTKVSEVYSDILGGLIPATSEDNAFTQQILPDQMLVTNWLLEPVTDWNVAPRDVLEDLPDSLAPHVPPKKTPKPAPTNTTGAVPSGMVPRIDVYQKLLDEYESERFRWEQVKLNARPGDIKDEAAKAKAWDQYNRMLSLFAPTIDKKLESLWATLVIRGDYHRVCHYLGLLDVETSSEALLRAKESLRASVMRSIDDTQDIYPVQFSPASWANYLTTDFTPVDLLMDPTLLRQQLLDKQQQRLVLMSRLGDLKGAQQDLTALQKKADDARAAYNDASNKMLQGFSDTTIGLIQMYMNSKNSKKGNEEQSLEKGSLDGVLKANNQPALSDAQFDQIKKMQSQAISNQTTFLSASEAVARTQAQLAGGIASDPALAISDTQRQIDSLSTAIETLKTILSSSPDPTVTGYDDKTKAAKEPEAPKVDGTLPPSPVPRIGASEWTSITMEYDRSSSHTSSSDHTEASHSSWSCSFFFGSGGQSSDSSSSSHNEDMDQTNTDVKVGFNIMKVDINRPWLDGSVLSNTADYFRLSSTPISKGDDVLQKIQTTTDAKTIDGLLADAEKGVTMPAYPVAFIVAKDITINFSNTFQSAGSAKTYMEKTTSSGGGILCFSISRSSHETTSNATAYTEASDTHINIRIPGPQIIGWVMQVVPQDKSTTKYERLDAKQFSLGGDPNAAAAKVPVPAKPVANGAAH